MIAVAVASCKLSSCWDGDVAGRDVGRPALISTAPPSADLSITSVILLLAFSALVLRAYYKTPLYDRQVAAETRGLKFLTSDYFPFFVNLLVCDLVQAIGFSLNVEVSQLTRDWDLEKLTNARCSGSCETNTLPLERRFPVRRRPSSSNLATSVRPSGAFLLAVISPVRLQRVHFLCFMLTIAAPVIFVAGRRVSRKAIYGAIIFQWIVVSIMTLVGPVAFQRHGDPFYAWSGGWCESCPPPLRSRPQAYAKLQAGSASHTTPCACGYITSYFLWWPLPTSFFMVSLYSPSRATTATDPSPAASTANFRWSCYLTHWCIY